MMYQFVASNSEAEDLEQIVFYPVPQELTERRVHMALKSLCGDILSAILMNLIYLSLRQCWQQQNELFQYRKGLMNSSNKKMDFNCRNKGKKS